MLEFEWDHFINLSEVDYPTVPTSTIVDELRKHRGRSFMNANMDKTATDRFSAIKRQGIEWTSVQCERYMCVVSRTHPC